ncbi:PAS domain S-box protein [Halogeometricum borinquense]|uniref:PAS domain S-box protein n=1 Tax=Halogeometricum borinquense TaxID=60847 RepID=A0A6C0UKV6_9EURY|nr:PAS domain S-box protein [Halogeometricum borinquense]QIB75877.1 PAS domain S-box protein [Halogeometricum borinquense]QIQ75540.1 PAS domain S-box protein [Halogeometricum borinquense]
MTDSYTVLVVGTLPSRFHTERFEAAFDDATLRWVEQPEGNSTVFEATDCILATTEVVSSGVFDPAAAAVPVLLIGDGEDSIAEIALSTDVVDYLAVRGVDAEATWLANRMEAAADSYRTDKKRTQLDRQQRALSDLGAFALSGPAREEVFAETVEIVTETLDAGRAALLQSRPEHGDLSIVAAKGWPQVYVGGVAVGLDSGPGRALTNREPVVENDLSSETTELTAHLDAGSELSVVVGGGTEPWGVLTAHSSESGAFDETDARFTENVAALIAAVIERETLRTTLEEMFSRMDQGLIGLDNDWRVTYMNPEAERLLDTSASEVVGTNYWNLFDSDAVKPFRERYEKAVKTGEKVSFESYFPPHDRWYEVEAYPSQAGLSVYFADITDRTEREMELLRYERMVEAADDGVYALDSDQHIVQVNQAFAEMFGREQESLIGMHTTELIDEDTAAESALIQAEAARTGEPKRMEFKAELPDGTEVWIETHFSAIVDEETDQFVGTVGVARDVTERRHRERSLTMLHERTREMAQADNADAVVTRTIEGCHSLFDPCRAAFFDYDATTRTLERHPQSDEVNRGQYQSDGVNRDTPVESENDPCWVAFTEEQMVRVEVGPTTVQFVPVGQYGVLAVERLSGATIRETDAEMLGLLAATMGELLGSVETKQALRSRDQQLEQQNERLTQLNRINRTVREVTRSVVHATTTEEATARACERLVEAEPYQFAWLCEAPEEANSDDRVVPMTTTGVEDSYAARLTEAAQTSPFPELLSRVASTGRRAVVNDVLDDPAWEPHRRDALAQGFRSIAVVPAGNDRLLVVHGTRPDTFAGEDGDVLVELGETLGAVIDRLGRTQPILDERQTEVELEIRDDQHFLVRLSTATGETATVTGVVPTAEGDYRTFVRTAAPKNAVQDALPPGTLARELTDEDDDEHLYEVQPGDTTPFETVYAGRGRLREMVAENGVCTVSLTIPSDVSVRSVVDAFAATYSQTTLAARRTLTEPTDSVGSFRARLDEVWTERQREAISAALHGGLYDWPRKTSVSTLSEAFDVSSPTFQYHLRAAERKLIELILD